MIIKKKKDSTESCGKENYHLISVAFKQDTDGVLLHELLLFLLSVDLR